MTIFFTEDELNAIDIKTVDGIRGNSCDLVISNKSIEVRIPLTIALLDKLDTALTLAIKPL